MLLMKGKDVADSVREKITRSIEKIKQEETVVTLAILLVGDDPASKVYKDRLVKLADSLGINVKLVALAETIPQEMVLDAIRTLNQDDSITGILPMMPMPKHISDKAIGRAIVPAKDIDCLNPMNVGEIYAGDSSWAACTPRAVIQTLEYYNIPMEGKHAVIIGRSNVVGKPVAQLLLSHNATVSICHSKTANLAEFTRNADIIVAAIGKPYFITRDMVKPGAVIVDVGINQVGDKLVGDVSPDVAEIASAFTPVPGGVGTVSTMMVMQALMRKYL